MEEGGQGELTPQDKHRLYWESHYKGIAAKLRTGQMTDDEFARKQAKERIDLEANINTDNLTKVFSRNHMEDEVQREMKERSGAPLGLAIVDLDNFKKKNDTYGHLAGDEILKKFAEIVKGEIDPLGGSVGRWGGEEFLILLPDTNDDELEQILTRCGNAVRLGTGFESNIPELQTMSTGVSIRKSGESYEDWLGRIDKLVYEAKDNGRNQMVMERQDGVNKVVKFEQS